MKNVRAKKDLNSLSDVSDGVQVSESKSDTRNEQWIRSIPYWFLLIVGMIYSTGFIVVTAHLESFGIRETGAALWKPRYIHIGVLCLVFVFTPTGLLLPVWYLLRRSDTDSAGQTVGKIQPRGKKQASARSRYVTLSVPAAISAALQAFYLLSLPYCLTILARKPYEYGQIRGMWPVFLNTVVTIGGAFGLRVASWLKDRNHPGTRHLNYPFSDSIVITVRYILLGFSLLFAVWLTLDYKSELLEMFAERGMSIAFLYIYTGLIVVLPLLLLISGTRLNWDVKQWIAGTVLAGSVLLPICYFAILLFAYCVFPFIPAVRGGGDYTAGRLIHVQLRAESVSSIQTEDMIGSVVQKPKLPPKVILLEETSEGYYLADPADAGGPYKWRRSIDERPEVLFIPKVDVKRVNVLNELPENPASKKP